MIYSNVKFWKKINILTLVLSEKKFLNETKNHNPPLQVKWSVPNIDVHQGEKNSKVTLIFSICHRTMKEEEKSSLFKSLWIAAIKSQIIKNKLYLNKKSDIVNDIHVYMYIYITELFLNYVQTRITI